MTILVITPELALAEKLEALFTRQNSPLFGQEYRVVQGFEKGFVALQGHEKFDAIVLTFEDYSEQLADLIDVVERQHKGPILVMTDNDEVRSRMRARGLKFILPRTSIDQDVFMSVLDASKAYFNLGESVQSLEEAYQTEQQRFYDVADQFADWLWEIDKSLKVVFSSSKRSSMENVEVGTLFTQCFLPEEGNRIEDEFNTLLNNPKPFQDKEFWSFDTYGSRKCWSLSGVPVFNKSGHVVGYRGVAKDISSEKASVDHLYFLSNNDALTGFYNRSRFLDELARTVKNHVREGRDGALLLLNLDRFKYVNEKYGYDMGDKIIVHVAQTLKSMVRSEDFVARTGADEFGILMKNVQLKDVEMQAREILRALSTRHFHHEGKQVRLSARVGAVSLGNHGSTSDQLLSHAHVALEEVRNQGNNAFCLFDDLEMRQKNTPRRMELLNFITHCLEEEQERLVLYYQPIVSLEGNNKVERYEVLVRLLDDENNIISPVKFIEIAEEYGLVSQLDKVVACRAMDALEAWQAKGRNVSLSVNISGKTFENSEIIERITHHLSTKNLQQGSLIFELTETSALKDVTKARRIIGALKSHGALFALDDCGVGYSSLDYIRQLDLDYIKIDGSFIRDLHRNKEDDAFVKALRDVARRLEIKTVAEMVEDAETVEYLKELGIDFAQGYHFAMPAAELPEEFDEIQQKTLN